MGTATMVMAFQLQAGVKGEDVVAVVPDLLSVVMDDVKIVYSSNGLKMSDSLVVALGNNERSTATLRYHSNKMLTLDVQHEIDSEEKLLPLHKPYTIDYMRRIDNDLQNVLGSMFLRSVSLHTPIRRPCRLPKNYFPTSDDRLLETDYTEELCDVISPYQRVQILQSREFGRVLMLDEDVMYGESDEIYMTSVLGLDRGNKFGGATVLILGGGDGGLLNTLVSLDDPPRHVLMAEIDDEVMKACRKYMPSVCGKVFDNYHTDKYQVVVRDCVQVLKESVENGVKFDYVINDLTEFSVETEKYGFAFYDFKTNNVLMELSFKCLKDNGKYLARGNCFSATPYLRKMEEAFRDIGARFKRIDRHVPSFKETYCFFEAQKSSSNGLQSTHS